MSGKSHQLKIRLKRLLKLFNHIIVVISSFSKRFFFNILCRKKINADFVDALCNNIFIVNCKQIKLRPGKLSSNFIGFKRCEH